MQSRRHSIAPSIRQFVVIAALALLVALAPLRVALGLAGLVGVGALAWAGPVYGVYLAILSVPVQQLVTLPGGTSFTQAAVLLMTGAWLLRSALQPGRPLVSGPLFWAWLALLAALLLSTAAAPYSQAESLRAMARWAVAFLVWFVAVNSVATRRELHGLICCLLAAPFACGLIGLYQFASGDGPPSFRIAATLPFVRAYGTIGQPNSFAGYMNMAWPLAVALAGAALVQRRAARSADRSVAVLDTAMGDAPGDAPGTAMGDTLGDGPGTVMGDTPGEATAAGKRSNFDLAARSGESARAINWGSCFAPTVGVLVALVLVGALAVSFSLGGWVGALVGAVGLLAALGWRWAVVALGGAGALLATLLLGGATLLPNAIGGRVTRLTGMLRFFDPATVVVTPENFSLVERMAQMKAGALMFGQNWLFGVGPGAYSLAYSDVTSPPWYASRGHAHNFYLHMAAEAGLIGLIAYLTLVVTTCVLAVAGLRRAGGSGARSILIGCCGVIAAVAGHNFFENLHVLNLGVQLSGIWALIVLVPRLLLPAAGKQR
ncbi:MAG: O-antigen ligase family protein [Roseiflexaceae bacterium]|nr:O-antigen ligase family protein [Roseiflexaceae bacterium]